MGKRERWAKRGTVKTSARADSGEREVDMAARGAKTRAQAAGTSVRILIFKGKLEF